MPQSNNLHLPPSCAKGERDLRGQVVNGSTWLWRDFDWAALASCDHLAYLLGSFAATAGVLGRSDRVFLTEFLFGARQRHLEAQEVRRHRLLVAQGRDGAGGRYHFVGK